MSALVLIPLAVIVAGTGLVALATHRLAAEADRLETQRASVQSLEDVLRQLRDIDVGAVPALVERGNGTTRASSGPRSA